MEYLKKQLTYLHNYSLNYGFVFIKGDGVTVDKKEVAKYFKHPKKAIQMQ